MSPALGEGIHQRVTAVSTWHCTRVCNTQREPPLYLENALGYFKLKMLSVMLHSETVKTHQR